jgi:hypothetical protein
VPLLSSLVARVRRQPVPVKPKAVLRIAYEPRRDGDADPGEVVWTWVPYEDDPKQGKDRPVLVIGHIGTQVAILPLTSKKNTRYDDCVELGSGPWDRSARVSYVKIDRLLRVSPAKIRREGGTLDRERFDLIVGRFQAYHAGRR